MRWTAFALLCLCAATVVAQPIVLPGETRGGAEPDTTAPWRYFPLAVGNAWEYARFPTGLPQIDLGTRRVDIEKDTLVEGTRYVIHRDRFYDANGELESGVQRTPIRFDTLIATVRESFMGGERTFREIPCPLDLPFDSEVLCGPFADDPYVTYGGYDEGTLNFPEATLVVTYKGYANDIGFTVSYAADFGEFIRFIDNGETLPLEYARIDGEEFGTAQFPVATGESVLGPGPLGLEVWPNPVRDAMTVTLTLPAAAAVRVAVHDVLGRETAVLHEGALPAGTHALRFDAAALPSGAYVVRAAMGETVATRRITVLR